MYLSHTLDLFTNTFIFLPFIKYADQFSTRGGEEVLLDVGGQDATEAFEDVGHSDEAREILEGLLVGPLKRQVNLNVLSFVTITSRDKAYL